MRVLITGSRDWPEFYRFLLDDTLDRLDKNGLTIVHGHCPTGIDKFADEWCLENGLTPERHPAQWTVNGKFVKSAGHKRNAEMVDLGADICYAFLLNDSPGTSGCIKLARAAGIQTLVTNLILE